MHVDPPQLSYLARFHVEIGPIIDLGETGSGRRRIVPIIGGSVTGPQLRGTVLAAGADFQWSIRSDAGELEARYAIQTEDGAHIYVENRGLRSGAPADLERLARGEPVDPALLYFRSSPRLHSTPGAWGWLNDRVFVGVGERRPDAVLLDVFTVE